MLKNLIGRVPRSRVRKPSFRFSDIRLGKSKRQPRAIDNAEHLPAAITDLHGFLRSRNHFGLLVVKNDPSHLMSLLCSLSPRTIIPPSAGGLPSCANCDSGFTQSPPTSRSSRL